jgi:hypothetical protein
VETFTQKNIVIEKSSTVRGDLLILPLPRLHVLRAVGIFLTTFSFYIRIIQIKRLKSGEEREAPSQNK